MSRSQMESKGRRRCAPRTEIATRLRSFRILFGSRGLHCRSYVLLGSASWCGPWAYFGARRQAKGTQKGNESEEKTSAGRPCGNAKHVAMWEAHRMAQAMPGSDLLAHLTPRCLRSGPEMFARFRGVLGGPSGTTFDIQKHIFRKFRQQL